MQTVSLEQITAVLRSLGIQRGDGLLVHSAIQYLGHPLGGVAMYYTALCRLLGIPSSDGKFEGTLAVATFNFGFCQGEPYDPWNSPSVGMGVFAEYVRQRPEARRTRHPMQSLAVVGAYADDLAERDTLSAFDPGSAFEHMLELDFKLLLLGADIQAASIVHYSEQRAAVPYRYWKDFTGLVRVTNNAGGTAEEWQERTYRMYVRDLEINAQLKLYPIQEELQRRGLWRSSRVNYGEVAACSLRDFVTVADALLATDPWILVASRKDQPNHV